MEVDLPLLEAAYHHLSLQLHPDCHPDADFATRLLLLDKTTQLNEAYATLSRPERRALYVLKTLGIDLEDAQQSFSPPASFLGRLLELREELHQAFAARQGDKLQSLERLAKEALQKELEAGCRHLRAFLSHGEKETLQQAATHLLCMRYWQRFLADAELFQEELFS